MSDPTRDDVDLAALLARHFGDAPPGEIELPARVEQQRAIELLGDAA